MDPTQLYHSVKWQNDILENQLTKLRDAYSVDNKKTAFVSSDIEYYIYINGILKMIYYALCIPVVYYTVFGKNTDMVIWLKFIIIFSVLSFPYIIGPLEYLVLSVVLYFYALIVGSVYKTNTFVHPPLSFVNT
jgi:hypothetical protein